jgi:chromosome partitioning protein
MVDVSRSLHRQVMSRLRQIHHLEMLGAAVPFSDEVERMGEERNPVAVFAPASPGAVSYQALWFDIQRRLRSRG